MGYAQTTERPLAGAETRLPMRILLLLGVLVVPLFAGCTSSGSAYETLSMDEWKTRLEATPGAYVLDVRTREEYAAGHIPGSALLPHTEIAERASELPADKSTPLFVYCRSGNRSTQASEALADMGYTNVVNMGDAGYPDWARAGYPTANGAA